MITVGADIGSSVEQTHYALVPSHEFSFSPDLHESSELFRQDWEHLTPDPYMADGGKYRLRRYGLYRLSATTAGLTHIPGTAFYQSIATNPVNGGQQRHFAALADNTVDNPFLNELIRFDFTQLALEQHGEGDWLIGVHQIRITATLGVGGNPTPEGTHRDDEDYTVQHLIERTNIGGGINYFFGSGREPTARPQAIWKQEAYFDSYYFDSSLWHSVSPIVSGKRESNGYRDVLLIDFVKSPRTD